MNLPSLNQLFQQSFATLKRFPLALGTAILASVVGIYLADLNSDQIQKIEYLYNVIVVSVLGISLFTVLTLICEKHGWNQIAAGAIGIMLLIGYYLLLPENLDDAPTIHLYRFLLFFIGLHLMVAIGPYWEKGEINGFWQYNKMLFLRILTAVFYSGVLFFGLSIALLSIDVLLDVEIDDVRYFQLFILIGGILNTWFFLAGIPSSIDKLNKVTQYPKGLKLFTQNILLPLVVIYMAILYLYTGKIIIEWSWPEGWVANLVLSFSIAGILALLLLHPIQEKAGNRWIKQFSRAYFWALIPLVILLLLAIWVRISEYSFTVNRYFVLILGLWLAGIVVYFVTSKSKNIKVIPASLGLIAFLISFGPWGAFSVSERSQVNRLQHYLQNSNLIKNGTVIRAKESVAFENRQEISSILRYLDETHGLEGIQPWFKKDLSTLGKTATDDEGTPNNRPQYITTQLIGIEYVATSRVDSPSEKRTNFYTDLTDVRDVQDFSWLIQSIQVHPLQETKSYQIPGLDTLIVESNTQPPHLQIYYRGSKDSSLEVDLNKVIQKLESQFPDGRNQLPPDSMEWNLSNNVMSARLTFRRISWSTANDSLTIQNALFDITLK